MFLIAFGPHYGWTIRSWLDLEIMEERERKPTLKKTLLLFFLISTVWFIEENKGM